MRLDLRWIMWVVLWSLIWAFALQLADVRASPVLFCFSIMVGVASSALCPWDAIRRERHDE